MLSANMTLKEAINSGGKKVTNMSSQYFYISLTSGFWTYVSEPFGTIR